MFPPIPDWDGLHPLVVHFPIALLYVAPVFVLLAIVTRKHADGFLLSAVILLIIGTIGAFVAVSTGEAAMQLADTTDPAVSETLERHEELAEDARTVFAILTVLAIAWLVLPRYVKPLARPAVSLVGTALLFVLLLAANVLLANAAHQGGRLVHELGVRAMTASP